MDGRMDGGKREVKWNEMKTIEDNCFFVFFMVKRHLLSLVSLCDSKIAFCDVSFHYVR